MGLDLVVEGCAKPDHEREWRQLLERYFADEELSEEEIERFQEISVPAYERIGAPRVGQDDAANKWAIETEEARTPGEIAAALEEWDGYYAVHLVTCDGVPKYSNGGSYEGVDETSFRGAFLEICPDVIAEDLLNEAWEHKFPEQALAYGKALLAAADATEAGQAPVRKPASGRSKKKQAEPATLADQLDIVRACGRWYIFWGERGHPIRAYF